MAQRQGLTIKGYHLERYLSSGGFGDVYKATKSVQGRRMTYALKIFDLTRSGAEKDMNDEIKAYRIVSQDPHCQEYIICMYDHFAVSQQRIGGVALEFMGGGDLNALIRRHPRGVPPTTLIVVMKDLLSGLAFIHSKGIAHRDIKPGNVLASAGDTTFKVGDMGGGCGSTLQRCTAWGTLIYLAPELARIISYAGGSLSQPISVQDAQKGDIWALGLVFWEMAFGKGQFPFSVSRFDSGQAIRQLANIARQSQIATPRYSRNAGNVSAAVINKILLDMLQVNPNRRPEAAQLLDLISGEIKGCSLDHQNLSRPEIEDMLLRNPAMRNFFRQKRFSSEMSMSSICSILREYLTQMRPQPVPAPAPAPQPIPQPRGAPAGRVPIRKAPKLKVKITDQEIVNKALKECAQKKKPYTCSAKDLKTTFKVIREKGGLPRSQPAHRALQNHYRNKPAYAKLGPCILCYYLSYRDLAMKQGRADPGLPAEMRGPGFSCIIKGKNIPTTELNTMAQLLGIPYKGVTKRKICEKIYQHLLSEGEIQRQMVARDIFQGIKIAVQDDIEAGITDVDPRKAGKKSREQRKMVDAILEVARLGGRDVIDTEYLKAQERAVLDDFQKLRAKTDLTQDQKKRALLDKRAAVYIGIVLNTINKWHQE